MLLARVPCHRDGSTIAASTPEATGGRHKELLWFEGGQPALHVCVVGVGSGFSGNTLQDFVGPLKFPQALQLCSSFSRWQLMGVPGQKDPLTVARGHWPTSPTTSTAGLGGLTPSCGYIF